jgi:mercuric ion transport protein
VSDPPADRDRLGGAGLVGAGVVACAACCAGPIVGFLGALGIAGLAGWLLAGTIGLILSAAVGIAARVARRRPGRRDAGGEPSSVPVPAPSRRAPG